MFCSQCGTNNPEGSSFCASCGHPMVSAPAATGAAPAPQYQQYQAPAPAPAPAPKGNVAQAWADITSSPNWIKRLLLLMLMDCVPVLDLYAKGYFLQWGAEAARGKANPLTSGTFDKKTILFGLVPYLLGILLSLGSTILYVFAFIPFVGWIATLVGSIMASAFYNMSVMRVGTTGKVGSAFDLSELFRVYRKNMGGLVFATFIPGLVGLVLVGLVGTLVMGITGAGILNTLNGLGSHYSYYSYGYDYATMFGFITSMSFSLVVIVVFGLFVEGFVSLWTMRAVGYWVQKNAPEWVEEATDSENPFKAAPRENVSE